MTHATYTLEDLADRTGFSPRQIRYYITRQLAPGAGERGPNVRYGDETLRRLLLVARLKELRIRPTGRTPSLDEITKMLDSLDGEAADRLLGGEMELAVVDTEAPTVEVIHALHTPAPDWTVCNDLEPSFMKLCETRPRPRASQPELGPLADPLSRLRELLDELVRQPSVDGGETWRRIRTPDIEIHVRAPGDPARRDRLEQALAVLRRLLDQEVRP